MKITQKDIEHVALLSRLEIPQDKMEEVTSQLDAILQYADVLKDVDTEGVEPTAHVLPLKNVFREDEVKQSLSSEEALANAPDAQDGYFKVPKIVEG